MSLRWLKKDATIALSQRRPCDSYLAPGHSGVVTVSKSSNSTAFYDRCETAGRMMDDVTTALAVSPDSPTCYLGITEAPTDDLTAEDIQKEHQLAPLSSYLEIGQFTDLNLVCSLSSKATIQLVANDPLSWITPGGSWICWPFSVDSKSPVSASSRKPKYS